MVKSLTLAFRNLKCYTHETKSIKWAGEPNFNCSIRVQATNANGGGGEKELGREIIWLLECTRGVGGERDGELIYEV